MLCFRFQRPSWCCLTLQLCAGRHLTLPTGLSCATVAGYEAPCAKARREVGAAASAQLHAECTYQFAQR